ncbi:hypothetical protein CRUP_008299 [Coryphaenoides rupestris]|nr:hypothetical protein CRUP_008299 [Coryphaenoides rupestris]
MLRQCCVLVGYTFSHIVHHTSHCRCLSMARIWANAATLYHVNFLFHLPSEMTCSGDARLNHSVQDPSYRAGPVWPSSATWHAVTPEPQDTQKGWPGSTPASWNSLDRSSGPRCFPEASMKEMTCSGDARLNHSVQDPSYRAGPVWPSSATWHAVTPEPQDTQKGWPGSTPASWNSLDRSSGPRCFPEASMKEVKGILGKYQEQSSTRSLGRLVLITSASHFPVTMARVCAAIMEVSGQRHVARRDPEPQDTQKGWPGSTPASWNSLDSQLFMPPSSTDTASWPNRRNIHQTRGELNEPKPLVSYTTTCVSFPMPSSPPTYSANCPGLGSM